ncbi:MAG TPA: permease prefix domain 1-containing protein [Pyrinomonadaceae bacterium]|nr:permease prefix domain 1-containing protein [Pyrinomonadaceae bacterium]
MLNLKTLARRLRGLTPRAASERQLDEELRFHLEMRAADNLAAGMTPAEASADALRRFGDLERIKDLCREIDEDNAFRKVIRLSLWLTVLCGAALWANKTAAQVKVLGEMLVVTSALCRLLMATRATRFGKQGPVQGGESIALSTGLVERRAGSRQKPVKAGCRRGRDYELG